jgi:structural maintenance of chromosome 2
MKDTIVELKESIKDAAARQNQAKQDAARIEKDMNEFKNNKDSKLQQLQVIIILIALIIETSRSVESCCQEARCNNQSQAQGISDSSIGDRYFLLASSLT